jgi:hypothetical protein
MRILLTVGIVAAGLRHAWKHRAPTSTRPETPWWRKGSMVSAWMNLLLITWMWFHERELTMRLYNTVAQEVRARIQTHQKERTP